jgi:hypothetical protein
MNEINVSVIVKEDETLVYWNSMTRWNLRGTVRLDGLFVNIKAG